MTSSYHIVFSNMAKWDLIETRDSFLLFYVLFVVSKTRAAFTTNEKPNQDRSCLAIACTRFPALDAGYMYLLRGSHWFIALFITFMFSQINYFGFGFKTLE